MEWGWEELPSSSCKRRLKSSVNRFLCLSHASMAWEESAEVENGHFSSFRMEEKSLRVWRQRD